MYCATCAARLSPSPFTSLCRPSLSLGSCAPSNRRSHRAPRARGRVPLPAVLHGCSARGASGWPSHTHSLSQKQSILFFLTHLRLRLRQRRRRPEMMGRAAAWFPFLPLPFCSSTLLLLSTWQQRTPPPRNGSISRLLLCADHGRGATRRLSSRSFFLLMRADRGASSIIISFAVSMERRVVRGVKERRCQPRRAKPFARPAARRESGCARQVCLVRRSSARACATHAASAF